MVLLLVLVYMVVSLSFHDHIVGHIHYPIFSSLHIALTLLPSLAPLLPLAPKSHPHSPARTPPRPPLPPNHPSPLPLPLKRMPICDAHRNKKDQMMTSSKSYKALSVKATPQSYIETCTRLAKVHLVAYILLWTRTATWSQ